MGQYLRTLRQYGGGALGARLPGSDDLPAELACAVGDRFAHGAIGIRFAEPLIEEYGEAAEVEGRSGAAKRFRHGRDLFPQRRGFTAAVRGRQQCSTV